MSLEAIQKVTASEQASQSRKADAAAAAKKLTADAQRAGESLLETARREAEAENKELLLRTEERAAKEAVRLRADAEAEAEAMCKAAEDRLDAAADLIVRRVVNGSWQS